MKLKYLLTTCLFLFLLVGGELFGQVEYKVSLLPDGVTYKVTMKPSVTWNPPFNLTSSAQVSLKAPEGGLTVSNLTVLVPGTSWSNNANYVEAGFAYINIGMTSNGTSAFSYQAGVEVDLFTFENSAACLGPVELVEGNDPFLPPNAQNANVGNQLSTLGGGPGMNVWSGNFAQGGANCAAGSCDVSIINAAAIQPTGCNGSNGSISVSATGTAPLEYSRDNGATWQSSNSFAGLGAGSYLIKVKNADCEVAYTGNPVVLSAASAPVVGNVDGTNPAGCGVDNGSISVSASGGSGSLEYSRDGGITWQAGNTFSGLAEGTYNIAVRNDDGSCQVSGGAVALTAPSAVTLSLMASNEPSTCGGNDGSISVAASNGSGSYEYRIDNGAWQGGNTFVGLSAGSYSIQAQNDGEDCLSAALNVTLADGASTSISTVASQNLSACDAGDGSITVSLSNASGSFEYSIDNGQTWQASNAFQNLAAGPYHIKVQNTGGGCATSYAQNPVVLTQPACNTDCLIEYRLTQLPNGDYQVSMIPDVTWNFPQNITSTAQVTVVAPAGQNGQGGFVVDNLTNAISGVTFSQNATYPNPVENPAADYFVFGMTSTGTSAISYQQGVEVPLFTFSNGGTCTGMSIYLMDNENDPFAVPNLQNANVGQQLTTAGSGPDADICVGGGSVPCTEPAEACLIEYRLTQLPNGDYQVSMLPDVSWVFPQSITSTAQVTVLAPAGGFVVDNLTMLLPGVTFSQNATYPGPAENTSADYFVFGLTSTGTTGIPYQQGVEVPLFTFSNAGTCEGGVLSLMDENDPFAVPNLQNANVGQQLTTAGSGTDADICVDGNEVPCEVPDAACLIEYELEVLPGGAYQVSMIPDTTWNFPQSVTSTAQVTVVVPTGQNGQGGFTVGNLTNLISGVEFANNANYPHPSENPSKDYILFGLTSTGTNGIGYEKGVKVPLFTFENVGTCTGENIYLMPVEGDPFAVPNLQNANVGQQLTTLGSGQDVPICVPGNSLPCLPCPEGAVDTDGDGICDIEENINGSNPNDPCDPVNVDTDGDGICDLQEEIDETDPTDPCDPIDTDTDGDGYCDNEELLNNTDPLNACDPDNSHPDCDCSDLMEDEVVYIEYDGSDASYCLPLSDTDLGFLDIILNDAPYTQPLTNCAYDTLIFYTYAFTGGGGQAGPYAIESWEVGGQLYSGTAADMDELTALMNQWDPEGNWFHNAGMQAIAGGHTNYAYTYGNFQVRQVNTGIPSLIQPNVTFVSGASQIQLGGPGEYEVVLYDPSIFCGDTVTIYVIDPSPEYIDLVTTYATPTEEVCVENTELPGNISTVSICGAPENGTVEFDGECFTYTPDIVFWGEDEFCVVMCNDTEPQFCDTVFVTVYVEEPDCEEMFADEVILASADDGPVGICTPVTLAELSITDIFLDGAPYLDIFNVCSSDTLTFYTYAFAVGQGNSGPYMVESWNVNGVIYTGLVANMDDLAAKMNQWDPAGNWQNDAQTSTLAGGAPNTQYGNLKLRHVLTQVPTLIQSNFTLIGTGIQVDVTGVGEHELIITNKVTGCTDTLTVVIIDVTPETITVTTENGLPTGQICVETDELPGNVVSITSCGDPEYGTVETSSPTCVIYSPSMGFVGQDEFCIVICDDSNPQFCDTTFVNVIVTPTTDTIDVVIDPIDPVEVCLEPGDGQTVTVTSASICGENTDEIDATIVPGTACVTLDPADDFAGFSEICVVQCYLATGGVEVCDTTIMSVMVTPPTDTLEITLDDFDPEVICLEDVLQLPGNIASVSVCGNDSPNIEVSVDDEACVTLDPVNAGNGMAEVCIVVCDDSDPQFCDTTIITIDLDVNCPDVWGQPDTIISVSPEVCAPLALSQFSLYDIVVNGAPYQYPPEGCALDSLVYYTYAFTVDQGASGPYQITWTVNGQVYNGTVQDVGELTDQMNTWNPSGNWVNNPATFSISGGSDFVNYGIMVIKHVPTNVPAYVQANLTEVAYGTYLTMDEVGINEVVAIDPETGCTDTLVVWVLGVTTETLSETMPQGTNSDEICLDVSELPGEVVSVEFCDEPENGLVSFGTDHCMVYTPESDFAGEDQFCVIVCDDFSPQICDTTIVNILVTPNNDEVDVTVQPIDPSTVCLDEVLDTEGELSSVELCNAPDGVNVTFDNDGCLVIDPADDFVGTTEICVTHCFLGAVTGAEICETTLVNVLVNPVTDTVDVTVDSSEPFEVCLDEEIDLAGTVVVAIVCGENTEEVDAEVGLNGCVTLDPVFGWQGTSQVCVVLCDDSDPALCDTTIINVTVDLNCGDVFGIDTMYTNEPKVCIPVEFSEIQLYDIVLNGTDYLFPPDPCNEIDLVFYTYSFTVGSGQSGPYDVLWNVNGSATSTTVQTMDDLAVWMNQVDPTGNWVNTQASSSVSGGDNSVNYGMMTLTHVGTSIPALLLPNYTEVAFGTCIYLDGPGWHELVLIDDETGCSDTLHIFVEGIQNVVVNPIVILQGAYDGDTGIMRDDLRQHSYLPTEEPYSGMANFAHLGGGGETTSGSVLATDGDDAIVDWVFLELRSANDPAQVVATRSALVQRDGDVVDVDGTSGVTFDVAPGDYHLAVRHRNHLGAMTANAYPLGAAGTTIDMTDMTTAIYGQNGMTSADGLRMLWGGNANSDRKLIFQGDQNDTDAVFFEVILAPGNPGITPNYIVDGYSNADTNMDGEVIFQGLDNDVDFMIFFNVLTNPQNTSFIINFIWMEQMP